VLTTESVAVAIARAHVEAWSNHDFDAARQGLADDVQVTATATNLPLPETNLSGADDYMQGLTAFAQGVVPGSARIVAALGDQRNAVLLLTVETTGPDGRRMSLPGARAYLLDEDGRIAVEKVVFYGVPA
jgi:hypothetical protein